jgi:hypothetical protein
MLTNAHALLSPPPPNVCDGKPIHIYRERLAGTSLELLLPGMRYQVRTYIHNIQCSNNEILEYFKGCTMRS